MKKILILIFCVVFLFSSCGKMEIVDMGYYDYPAYTNIDHALNHSDIVVKGKVVNQIVKELDTTDYEFTSKKNWKEGVPPEAYDVVLEPFIQVHTISTIEILENLHGKYNKGDTIDVKQLGGVYENKNYVTNDVKFLKSKKVYLLLLAEYENKNMPTDLISPDQGAFEVSNKKIRIDSTNSFAKLKLDNESFIENNMNENILFSKIHKAIKNKKK